MDKRPGILPELIIPVGAILFAIYYLSTVWALPFQAKVVGIYVSGAIGLLSLILFLRFGREISRGEKSLGFGGFFSTGMDEARRWGVMAATALFILLLPYLGLTVAMLLFVFSTVLMVGGRARLRAALLIAFGITATAFSIFILFVQVRLPLSAVDLALRSLVY